MNIVFTAIALLLACANFALAGEYQDISDFAQSICGDIPEGSLNRNAIEGAVEANAGVLAKILSGGAKLSAEEVRETYKGIPLKNLPSSIPTVSMCKSELVKAIFLRVRKVTNSCRHPDFGQIGWTRSEDYTNSSGRMGGGHDENWWCNEVASQFLASRAIGPQNHIDRLGSSEESHKDWKGHVDYKYHCSIRVQWEPIYAERQDASHCGTHEE